MVESEPGVAGLEFIEFATSDKTEVETLERVLAALGFVVAGRHRRRQVQLFRQAEINVVLNGEPTSFARSFAALHGLSVCALGLRVANAKRALQRMRDHGAQEYSAEAQAGELDAPAIRGVAGTLIYLVDLFGERGNVYDEDFELLIPDGSSPQSAGLRRVDHIAQTVPAGSSRRWISYYARHFGLTVLEHAYIPDAGGFMISTVVGLPGSRLYIVLNDPRTKDTSEGQFLQQSLGGGVQHIAFQTDDIFRMLESSKRKGLSLLPVPASYYGDLEKEGYDPALIRRLEAHGVMMDTAGGGRFLHAYTQPVAGGFFFEIVQRDNHQGFGLHDVVHRPQAMAGQEGRPAIATMPPPILEDLGTRVEAGTTLAGTVTDRNSDIATPEAMGRWFSIHGTDAVWLTFRIASKNLTAFLAAARVLENLKGFTATTPHKAALLPLLDQVSERARRIGAVNVVRRESSGRLVADNMEGLGLVKALGKKRIEVRGASVWLVGAGATGRAIAWALAEADVGRLSLEDLDSQRAGALAADLKAVHRDLAVEPLGPDPGQVDIAINATPIGYHPLPLEPSGLKAGATVADVVLTPPKTNLVMVAEERGYTVLSGREVLEGQLELFADFLRLDA